MSNSIYKIISTVYALNVKKCWIFVRKSIILFTMTILRNGE